MDRRLQLIVAGVLIMRVWRQHWSLWILGACVCTAGAMANNSGANAQGTQRPPRKEYPSNINTEKIKPPAVYNDGRGIAPASAVVDDTEKAAPAVEDKPATKSVGTNPFQKQMDELWRCRYQVAMKQRMAPAKIRAGRVLVRFNVNTKGEPINTAVVAVEPADASILTCVKQEVGRWRLLPLPREPMAIESEISLALPKSGAETTTASGT
ncbi:MAG: hypothetical protein SF187_21710 [Deltaproteobacteria bacterium]|nr:hypothetical protein [Deltaproteobacteria bacterium]